ncbi:MAG: hypothetical protein H7325_06050, partial [Pedobacter sp.]|nr:hypothetical protein [Pedobacter sp.]
VNYFLKNDGQKFTAVANVLSSASSKSKFNLALQPLFGMDFTLTDNFGLGFDVAYVCVNWNKSLENMHFDSVQNIVIPDHKTSNVFLAGRIIF